ncbi:uncharacterized protein K460DRAFT_370826 [Cucurbitaria berberidis CBS 394.84]|uniref:Uncharacterized protein n=1 Tax=Cucurbitaria berberidis CBS 394.84 TaxID=1168544 RepID=A0A9P4L3X4_9PLEO|nr:uncharacterized protein K460DRAFT_370826 [Cucurbitaria berberidis CBS 394.84]KAF1840845.1 hypothetical protein K460DRAFT_370826 [Cucurbitaria berberidis CBS 394.84]
MLPSRQIARRIPTPSLTLCFFTTPILRILRTERGYSDISTGSSSSAKEEVLKSTAQPSEEAKPKKKTQAELDQELQLKLQGLSGDGGDAGVEYEDGKPVSMKRSVKNNMFRYI